MRKLFSALGVAGTLIISGCATYSPKWTPETVKPPEVAPESVTTAPPLETKAAPVEVPAAPTAPIPITRDSAVLTALLHNRAVEVARFGPQIGQTLTPEARAEFDPSIVGALTVEREERDLNIDTERVTLTRPTQTGDPIQDVISILNQTQRLLSVINAEDLLKVDSTSGSLGLLQRLPTGTAVSITGTGGSVDSNLTDEQDASGVSIDVAQSLLQGAGPAVNLVSLRQARNRAAQSDLAFREQVLDLVRQVEIAYGDLSLAYEVLGIRRFAVQLADEQLRRNEELERVGKIIEGDVIAARAEKASRVADQTEAEAALRVQTLAMIQLLNPPAARQWELELAPADKPQVEPPRVSPETSEQLALQYRPDLAQARLDLANSDLDVLRAKNQLLPRLDIVGSYSTSDVSGGTGASNTSLGALTSTDTDNYSVGLQLEHPILNRAEKARYRRAQLVEKQQSESIANIEQTIGREVRQATVNAEKTWQQIQATQEAVQSRTEQLRVAQGRYEVGKTTNLDLLIVQRDLIQAQLDDATARVRYIEALTSLFAAEGTLLERRGISLDLARKEQSGVTGEDANAVPTEH